MSYYIISIDRRVNKTEESGDFSPSKILSLFIYFDILVALTRHSVLSPAIVRHVHYCDHKNFFPSSSFSLFTPRYLHSVQKKKSILRTFLCNANFPLAGLVPCNKKLLWDIRLFLLSRIFNIIVIRIFNKSSALLLLRYFSTQIHTHSRPFMRCLPGPPLPAFPTKITVLSTGIARSSRHTVPPSYFTSSSFTQCSHG